MQLNGCTEQETIEIITALLVVLAKSGCYKCKGTGIATNQWDACGLCPCVSEKQDAT